MKNRNLLLIIGGLGAIVIFMGLACFIIALIANLSSSNKVVLTHTPVPANTQENTGASVTPDASPPFVSGGLGLSQADWEKVHTKMDLDYVPMGTGYDGKYDVMFQEGKVWLIGRQWSNDNAVTSEEVELESKNLIPVDSQFIKKYSPEGRPETIVNLYLSESLKSRFDSKNSITGDWWDGGEPGSFIVQYNVYDHDVNSMIISIGNNP